MKTPPQLALLLSQVLAELQGIRQAIRAQNPEVLARRAQRREEKASRAAAEEAERVARYEALLDHPVEQIGLRASTVAKLKAVGIRTVRELYAPTKLELRKRTGLWIYTVDRVRAVVERFLAQGGGREGIHEDSHE